MFSFRCVKQIEAINCPHMMQACRCFPYPNGLHCDFVPTSTTTTTTSTSTTTYQDITSISTTSSDVSSTYETTTSGIFTTPGSSTEVDEASLLWLWILLAIILIGLLLLILGFMWWRKRRLGLRICSHNFYVKCDLSFRWGRNPDRHHTPWHLSILVFLCLPFTSFKSSLSR